MFRPVESKTRTSYGQGRAARNAGSWAMRGCAAMRTAAALVSGLCGSSPWLRRHAMVARQRSAACHVEDRGEHQGSQGCVRGKVIGN